MDLIKDKDDPRLAQLEQLHANDWGLNESNRKNNESWRCILSSLRSALSELHKWRNWSPDDEDLKDAKEQYGYGSSRAATTVYVGMLEHKLRAALSELAEIREREKTSVTALRQFLFSFDAVVKKSGYKAALTKLSIAKQGARAVLALLEGGKG
jgi:outer membrane protein OmpA-like peptidoglycan-associated protein